MTPYYIKSVRHSDFGVTVSFESKQNIDDFFEVVVPMSYLLTLNRDLIQ